MTAIFDTLSKNLGTYGFIVFVVIALMGIYGLIVIAAKLLKVDVKLFGTSIKTPDDVPASHAVCPLRDDIAAIVVAVKDSAYETFETLYLQTRSRQMAAIDMALTQLKIALESAYSSHLKAIKPNASQEEMNDNLAIYHILAEAVIKKIMGDVRTYVFMDDIFNIEDEKEWVAKRDKIINQIMISLESEIDKYFPKRLLISCSMPSEFLNDTSAKRSELIKKTLLEVMEDCRVYSAKAVKLKETSRLKLKDDIQRIIHRTTSQTPEEFEHNLDDALS